MDVLALGLVSVERFIVGHDCPRALVRSEASKAGRDQWLWNWGWTRPAAVKAAVSAVVRSRSPGASARPGSRLNGKFAADEQVVRDGDEVAVIGMVSGG